MAVLISVFSTHYFSGPRTAHVIILILHWLFPSVTRHPLYLVHIGIRKAAHVFEFAVFSITVSRNSHEPRRMETELGNDHAFDHRGLCRTG
jgi:hypothetical protein